MCFICRENYRNQNIAKHILDFVREDLSNQGIQALYLITDHTEFYEKNVVGGF